MNRRSLKLLVPSASNVAFWALSTLFIISQLLGMIWDSTTYVRYLEYGRSPLYATQQAVIPGSNDEPFSDRNLVCMAYGRSYIAMQLSAVLRDPQLAKVTDTTGASISGYRVVKREKVATLDPLAATFYLDVCTNIDRTLEAIQQSYAKLGYNVTTDVLRIVDDVYSNVTREIPRALPILVLPYWDNGIRAHYAIPG